MKATLQARRVSTGETRVVELGPHHPLIGRIGFVNDVDDLAYYLAFELGQNNWSCDCNRSSFFGEEGPDVCEEKEFAVDWFEVDGVRYAAEDDYGRGFQS